MRHEDMTIGQRIVLTVVIVLIVLFALSAVGYLSGRWEAQGQEQLYQGIPLNQHLTELDKDALEMAYKQHAIKLWTIWVTDGIGVVHRINNGLRISREAYGIAAAKIEERERALRK